MTEKNRQASLRRGTARMGLTETAYAQHLGISQPAVNALKRANPPRLVLHEDGSIDQVASDERYFATTDLTQSERGRAQGTHSRAEGGEGRAGHMNQLMRARTLRELVMGQLGREKLARMRSEVVDRAEAQNIVFTLARRERDAWLQWPTRVAAAIAAELGSEGHALDIHRVQVCLEYHVQAHLEELPEVDPEPFPVMGEGPEDDEDQHD